MSRMPNTVRRSSSNVSSRPMKSTSLMSINADWWRKCGFHVSRSFCAQNSTKRSKFCMLESESGSNLRRFSLVTLFLMLYTIGPGTVPFVLMAELCPPHVSDKNNCLCSKKTSISFKVRSVSSGFTMSSIYLAIFGSVHAFK